MKYDSITLQRIAEAHPKIRNELKELYLQCNNEIVPTGKRLRFSDVYRSFEEQQKLYDQGRIDPGKVVTNARPGESYHNYGLAFDIVIVYGYQFQKASWVVDDLWLRIAYFFKDHGYSWGGDWSSFKDYPHFQKTFGYSEEDLMQKGGRYPII